MYGHPENHLKQLNCLDQYSLSCMLLQKEPKKKNSQSDCLCSSGATHIQGQLKYILCSANIVVHFTHENLKKLWFPCLDVYREALQCKNKFGASAEKKLKDGSFAVRKRAQILMPSGQQDCSFKTKPKNKNKNIHHRPEPRMKCHKMWSTWVCTDVPRPCPFHGKHRAAVCSSRKRYKCRHVWGRGSTECVQAAQSADLSIFLLGARK